MASRLRRHAVIVPSAVALIVAGAAVAWAQQKGDTGGGYRTAVVGTGDVTQTLDLTGTVSVVDQAKARFRTSGTVASVSAAGGQKVAAGQVLATLDSQPLTDAVTAAKATLAKAKATLETDSADDSSADSSAGGSAPTGAGDATAGATVAAQQALTEASQALSTATTVCSNANSPTTTPSTHPTTTPSTTPSTTPTTSPEPSITTTASPGVSAALQPTPVPNVPGTSGLTCERALAASLAAQQRTSAAQQVLARALQAQTSSSDTAPTQSATDTTTLPAQRGGGGSYSSQAAQIIKDKADVAASEVALAEAEKDLAAVTLRAPIAGTVASLPWTKGGTASVGDAAVILGRGTVDLTVQVASSSIRSVKTGLAANVRVDGGTTTLTGVVSRIGLLADNSTSNTTTYPVTVRVASGAALIDGSSAAVSIVLKTVKNAVTVPNSALHDGTVITLSNGTTKTTTVKTGAKGSLVTEVTSGLKAGDIVVLADPSEELPTSSTNNNTFTPGGTGGPPAGFNGGPPPGFTGGTGTVRRG